MSTGSTSSLTTISDPSDSAPPSVQQYLAVPPIILPILQSWDSIAFSNLGPRGIPVPLPPTLALRIQGYYYLGINLRSDQPIISGASLAESREIVDAVAAFLIAVMAAANADRHQRQVLASIAELRKETEALRTETRRNTKKLDKIGKDVGKNTKDINQMKQDVLQIKKDVRKNTQDILHIKQDIRQIKQDVAHSKKLERWTEATAFNHRRYTHPGAPYKLVPTFKMYGDRQEYTFPPNMTQRYQQLSDQEIIGDMPSDDVDAWLLHYDLDVEPGATLSYKRKMLLFYVIGRFADL